MGIKIKDLPNYNSINRTIAQKDLLEVSKNNGTYDTPDYNASASKKLTIEQLTTIINVDLCPNIVNTSNNYVAVNRDNVIADATVGAIQITIPDNTLAGICIYIKAKTQGTPSDNVVVIYSDAGSYYKQIKQTEWILLRYNGFTWDEIATNTGLSQTDINNSVGKYTGFASIGTVGAIGGNTITFNSGTYYNLAGELTTYATTVITPNWSAGVGRISSVYLDLTDGIIKSQSSPLTLQDHATRLEMVTLTNSSANLVTGYVASWDYIQNAIELETSLNYYAKRKTGLNVVSTANTALNLNVGRFFQKGSNLQNDLTQLNWYDISSQSPLTYFISNRNAIESVTPQTLLSAISDSYDLNGTVTALANNKFQNLRVYGTFDNPSGSLPTILIQRGQTEYASLSDAQKGVNTESYVLNPLTARIWFLGIVTVKKGFTATNSLTDCAIANTNDNCQIGGGGGASVDLTNYVTTDTAQTISAQKTFTLSPILSSVTASTLPFLDATKKIITATGSLFGTWLNGLTAKSTVVDADVINVLDSASSFEAKKTTLAQLFTYISTKVGLSSLTNNYIPKSNGAGGLVNSTYQYGSGGIVMDDWGFRTYNASIEIGTGGQFVYGKITPSLNYGSNYAGDVVSVGNVVTYKTHSSSAMLAKFIHIKDDDITVSNRFEEFRSSTDSECHLLDRHITYRKVFTVATNQWIIPNYALNIFQLTSTGTIFRNQAYTTSGQRVTEYNQDCNTACVIELKSSNAGLGLPLISGNLATTRNGNEWYDTSVHAPKIVNNGVVNELATYKFDEIFQITDCINVFSTAYTGVYIPFIPKCDMDVTKIFYNLQSTGTDVVRVAIYSDSGNAPTTLLIQSTEATTGATTLGQRSITISKTRLIGGTRYWLAIKNDVGATSFLAKNNVYSNNITKENYIGGGAFVGSPAPTSSVNAVWLAIGI